MGDDTLDGRHRESERGEERFSLDPGRALKVEIDNPNGAVAVRAVDRAELLVRYEKIGVPGTPAYDGAEIEIQFSGDRLVVRPILPAGGGGSRGFVFDSESFGGFNPFKGKGSVRAEAGRVVAEAGRVVAEARTAFAAIGGNGVRYDLEIEVPRSLAVAEVGIGTASGDISVEETSGQVRVRTASGDVRLRAIRGEVAAESASGDLLIQEAVGSLHARTASGDVRIAGGDLLSAVVRTASGDLRLDASLAGPGPFRLETVSGDIGLHLASPADAGAEPELSLSFRTVSGKARVAAPFRAQGSRSWRVGGGGGAEVAVKSVSGDLDANLRGQAAATGGSVEPSPPSAPSPHRASDPVAESAAMPEPPEPPERLTPPPAPVLNPDAPPPDATTTIGAGVADREPEPANDRLSVLRAVERGEIDIEEALRELDDPGAARER